MSTTLRNRLAGGAVALALAAGAVGIGIATHTADPARDRDPAPFASTPKQKATPPATLRVLTANLYVNNKRLDAADAAVRKAAPVVAGLQEARKATKFQPAGYQKVTKTDVVWASQNPVLVRKGVPILGQSFHELTPRTGPEFGVDAPRWVTIVTIRWEGEKWAVFNTHLPPRPRAQGVATEYRAGFEKLMDLADARKDRGKNVVIVGDLNERPRAGIDTWKWCPCMSFDRFGYSHHRSVVDYIAVDQPGTVADSWRIPKSNTGSDHDWLAGVVRHP